MNMHLTLKALPLEVIAIRDPEHFLDLLEILLIGVSIGREETRSKE